MTGDKGHFKDIGKISSLLCTSEKKIFREMFNIQK